MRLSWTRAGRPLAAGGALLMCSMCMEIAVGAQTAPPAQTPVPARPAFPVRTPHEPGYVAAKELADGINAPADEV